MSTPQQSAVCQDCGAENARSSKTCWLCGGTRIAEAQAAEAADSRQAMQAYRSPHAPAFVPERQNQFIFTLTLVLLGLALLVVAIGILVENDFIGFGIVFGLLSLIGLSIAWAANSGVRSQVRNLSPTPRVLLTVLFVGTLCLLALFIALFTICSAVLLTA